MEKRLTIKHKKEISDGEVVEDYFTIVYGASFISIETKDVPKLVELFKEKINETRS